MTCFSQKVKERRDILNLSQKQLAEQSGVCLRTIASYEAGERFPHPAQLYKLAKALGVSTCYLKDDTVTDPAFGLDHMDYVEEMRQKSGSKAARSLDDMLRENAALFAGGSISEKEKDAYFQALMKAYLECKEAAKQTFGRKNVLSENTAN